MSESIFKSTLFFLCLLIHIPHQASARWLWVKGDHKGRGCETILREALNTLSTTLHEKIRVQLAFDGQILNCKESTCAYERLKSSGGQVALLTQSICTHSQLEISAVIISDQKELQYKTRISRLSHKKPPITSDQLTRLILERARDSGRMLGNKITKGPAPPTQKKVKTSWWAVQGGVRVLSPSVAVAQGLSTGVEWLQMSSKSHLEWGIRLSVETPKNNDYQEELYSINLGFRSHLRRQRLSPFFGGGVGLEFSSKDDLITSHQLGLNELVRVEKKTHRNESTLYLTSSLETGIYWWGVSLQPYLLIRLIPLKLIDFDMSFGAISLIGGLRW